MQVNFTDAFVCCRRINKLRGWNVFTFTPPIAFVPSRSGSHYVGMLNSHDPVAFSRLAEQSISAFILDFEIPCLEGNQPGR